MLPKLVPLAREDLVRSPRKNASSTQGAKTTQTAVLGVLARMGGLLSWTPTETKE